MIYYIHISYNVNDPIELSSKSATRARDAMCICLCDVIVDGIIIYDCSAGDDWLAFGGAFVVCTYLWLAARPCTWPGPRGFGPGRYTGRCGVEWAWECWANWSTGQAWWRPRHRRHCCRRRCRKWRRQRQWRWRPTGPHRRHRRRRPAAGRARRPWATRCSAEDRRGSRRTRPSSACLLPARRRGN